MTRQPRARGRSTLQRSRSLLFTVALSAGGCAQDQAAQKPAEEKVPSAVQCTEPSEATAPPQATKRNRPDGDDQLTLAVEKHRAEFLQHLARTLVMKDADWVLERRKLLYWHHRNVERLLESHTQAGGEDPIDALLRFKKANGTPDRYLNPMRDRADWLRDFHRRHLSDPSNDLVMTDAQGGMRLDVVGLSIELKDGKPFLRIDALFWGVLKDHERFGPFVLRVLRESKDEAGVVRRHLAKIESQSATPTRFHPSGPNPPPERWLHRWPPGVGVGSLKGLPSLPADATRISIEWTINLRTLTGATERATFVGRNIPVELAWTAPSSVWAGDDLVEATDDDLRAAGFDVDSPQADEVSGPSRGN